MADHGGAAQHMRVEVLWAIRDARGLDANEKAILWSVESRGTSYSTLATICADVGMAEARFYRWRRSLATKGLLHVIERTGTSTEYRVDAQKVISWATPDLEAPPRRGVPQNEGGGSAKTVEGGPLKRGIEEDPEGDSQEDFPSSTSPFALVGEIDVWDLARYGGDDEEVDEEVSA